MNNLRLYSFTNMYLSSIQNGIQTAHCVHEMFTNYMYDSHSRVKILYEWAKEDKTIIVLNGGYSSNLSSLRDMFMSEDNQFPWSCFRESADALDGALTCVSIILPEYIYELSKILKTLTQVERDEILTRGTVNAMWFYDIGSSEFYNNDKVYNLTDFDKELVISLSTFRLAS